MGFPTAPVGQDPDAKEINPNKIAAENLANDAAAKRAGSDSPASLTAVWIAGIFIILCLAGRGRG